MEERFEKACHFLQLLTHSGYLVGEDAHLVQREENKEESSVSGPHGKVV